MTFSKVQSIPYPPPHPPSPPCFSHSQPSNHASAMNTLRAGSVAHEYFTDVSLLLSGFLERHGTLPSDYPHVSPVLAHSTPSRVELLTWSHQLPTSVKRPFCSRLTLWACTRCVCASSWGCCHGPSTRRRCAPAGTAMTSRRSQHTRLDICWDWDNPTSSLRRCWHTQPDPEP